VDSVLFEFITRGEQALFNLEIKKKRRSSIEPEIHQFSALINFVEILEN